MNLPLFSQLNCHYFSILIFGHISIQNNFMQNEFLNYYRLSLRLLKTNMPSKRIPADPAAKAAEKDLAKLLGVDVN
jgi:hypothetical protein